MEDEGSRLKATTSQIYQCLSTHKPSPGIPSAQGFHKWKDILVPAWTEEKSSCNLFVGKYRTVTACQFYFIRGKKKKKKKTLPLSIVACVSENPQYPEQSPTDGNESIQKCYSHQLLYSRPRKNEDSVSKPRNIDYYKIPISARTSSTCGMFAPYSPFRNSSSLQNSCKSEIIPTTVFPIKGTTVPLLLSPACFCRWSFQQQRKFKGSNSFPLLQPKIWGFFKEVPPTEQLCFNSRLALSYRSCG